MEQAPSRKARILAGLQSHTTEILLGVGLVLLTVALWPICAHGRPAGVTSLAAPALVILWIAMPVRASFVARPAAPDVKRRQA